MAVVLVVAYHAGVPGFPGGFIGVDVFFVISGFLISRLLLDEACSRGHIDLANFYARRIRRILPALVLVVACVLAATPWVSFTREQLEQASASGVAALFFYSNFFFWSQADSYFAPHLDVMPLLHTWSLAIEEQFYMVWPLALSAVVVVARDTRRDVKTMAAWFFGAVLLASLAFSVWSTGPQPLAAFYLMPSRAWELATGGLLAVHANRFHAWGPLLRSTLGHAGLAGIVGSAMLFSAETPFPGFAAIVPVLATALVIASAEGAALGERMSTLCARPVVFVGLLSYSWYLWHWPLLALRRLYYLGERSLAPDLLACAAALGMAYLSYRFIETPVRTMRFRFLVQTRWTVLFGAALCLAGFVVTQVTATAALPLVSTRLADAAADKPPLQDACITRGQFEGFPKPDSTCSAGAAGTPIGVVLWGDSHASHLMPMVSEVLGSRHLAVLQRTRTACPPILNATTVTVTDRRADVECLRFNAAVVADLAERRKAGLRGVILAARWALYLTEPPPNPREAVVRGLTRIESAVVPTPTLGVWPHDRTGTAQTLEVSLRDTLGALQKLGLSALVVAPTPEMVSPVPRCLARRHEGECGAPRAAVDERRATPLSAVHAAAAGFDRVTVWDPIDLLCNSATCFVVRDGIVMYTDEDHFTASWSRRLAAAAASVVEWLIRPPAGTTQPSGPFARLSVR